MPPFPSHPPLTTPTHTPHHQHTHQAVRRREGAVRPAGRLWRQGWGGGRGVGAGYVRMLRLVKRLGTIYVAFGLEKECGRRTPHPRVCLPACNPKGTQTRHDYTPTNAPKQTGKPAVYRPLQPQPPPSGQLPQPGSSSSSSSSLSFPAPSPSSFSSAAQDSATAPLLPRPWGSSGAGGGGGGKRS